MIQVPTWNLQTLSFSPAATAASSAHASNAATIHVPLIDLQTNHAACRMTSEQSLSLQDYNQLWGSEVTAAQA